MPTSYSTLLGLALPVTGELSGTWGDEVNNYITQYLDSAVAGTQTISGSQTAVTLSRTTNAALSQAGSGSTGSSQYQVINCTGNPAGTLTVTVPSTSKVYLVLNNTSTSQSVVVKPSAAAGVTVAAARAALIAWNGTDFELVATDDASKLNGVLAAANGGTGQSSYTTGDILFASGSTTLSKLADVATGNALISGGVGVAPSYGKIGLTTHVSGTLPIANGGTNGTATPTAGTVAYGTGTAYAFNTAGTSGQPLLSGGSGAPTFGTLSVAAGGTGLTSTPANGALDIGNGTGFTRATLTAGSGVSISNGAGSITISATGSGGTVTSVGATAPVASSGGNTPTISLNSAYGDTLNPYGSKTANFFLAAPNGSAGAPTFRAIVAADIPTLNQNTTGTAANITASSNSTLTTLSALSLPGSQVSGNISGNAGNVTGTVAVANGGTGSTTAGGARTNLGATTVGANFFTLTNPTAVTFPRINADNTVSALDAATFRSAIGAGTGSGTVTSVATSGSVNGITLTGGTITSTGTITLGGTLSGVSLTTQVSGTLPIANGGTGTTSTQFVNLASNVTGTLPVANGGTGATTLTANNVILGNGTSAVQVVAPGASGNILTSNGTTWTSATPSAGGYLYQPSAVLDRQLTFAGSISNSNTQGTFKMQCVQLTSTTELVIFYGIGNTGYGLYAVAWDNTAKTFGSTALLVNNTNLNTSETQDNVAAIQTGTNSVLVCYINANANLVAGVVTASGTTLTVGSFSAASTGIDTPILLVKNCFKNGFGRIFQMGTTYVLPMYITDQIFFYPITISGTTVTISARLSVGASLPLGPALSIVSLYVLRMSATRLAFLTNVNDGNGFIGYAGVVNVSGASITQVAVTETQGGYGTSDFTGFGLLSTGRVIFAYRSPSAVLYVAFMNTSGTLQQSTSLTTGGNTIPFVGQVVNDKAYYALTNSGNSYIISDTGSTPVISSALGTGYSVPRIMHYDGTNVYTLAQSSPTIVRAINISGSTPTLTSVITGIVTTTSLTGFGQVRGLSSTEYLNLDYNGTNGAGLIYSTSTNRTYPSFTFCTTAAALVASGATANVVLAIPANLVSDSQWAVMSSLSTSAMFSAGYTANSTQIQIRRIEIT